MNQTNSLHERRRAQAQLNFWVTNRIPRRWFTLAMGRLSKVRHPWIAKPCIALWQRFSDLDLSEAREQQFASIHACFVRQLKPGLRPFDNNPDLLCSPCDAIVGAQGIIGQGELLQTKGMVYTVQELLQSQIDAQACEGYHYVTLRLTASMYHHFHAPHDLNVKQLRYIHGDVWNVNPPTLKRISSLFTKNERAVIELSLSQTGQTAWVIPVAAVLVASMRFTFSDLHLHLRYRGPTQTEVRATLTKGQHMGWFEHGSTIICLIPPTWQWVGPDTDQRIKAGQAIYRKTDVKPCRVSH